MSQNTSYLVGVTGGLGSGKSTVCRFLSETGCRLFEAKIPMDEHTRELAKEYKIIPSVAALSGGEDYELLFTVQQNDYEKIKDIEGITIIGYMTAASEGKFMITPDGKSIPITAQGWDGMKAQ